MDTYKIIKNRRLELGLTLKDVASALGVAESTVSRYESSDIQNMGIDKIEALARVLKCSPTYLMGWETKNNIDLLSDDEMLLLEKYRNADEASKEFVRRVLKYAQLLNLYPDIPDTLEELEKKYPPVGSDNAEGKIG